MSTKLTDRAEAVLIGAAYIGAAYIGSRSP